MSLHICVRISDGDATECLENQLLEISRQAEALMKILKQTCHSYSFYTTTCDWAAGQDRLLAEAPAGFDIVTLFASSEERANEAPTGSSVVWQRRLLAYAVMKVGLFFQIAPWLGLRTLFSISNAPHHDGSRRDAPCWLMKHSSRVP
jgi:hypothetical protein